MSWVDTTARHRVSEISVREVARIHAWSLAESAPPAWRAMKPPHSSLLTAIATATTLTVVGAIPPTAPTPPAPPPPPTSLPVPPSPPPEPPSKPVPPAPTPPAPGPSKPTTPEDKRCSLDKPHRAHNWTDKTGQIYKCDGGAPALPR